MFFFNLYLRSRSRNLVMHIRLFLYNTVAHLCLIMAMAYFLLYRRHIPVSCIKWHFELPLYHSTYLNGSIGKSMVQWYCNSNYSKTCLRFLSWQYFSSLISIKNAEKGHQTSHMNGLLEVWLHLGNKILINLTTKTFQKHLLQKSIYTYKENMKFPAL